MDDQKERLEQEEAADRIGARRTDCAGARCGAQAYHTPQTQAGG